MRKSVLLLLVFILAVSLALAACGKGESTDNKGDIDNGVSENNGDANDNGNGDGQGDADDSERYAVKGDPNMTANLTIWAITPDDYTDIVPEFNKYYPNVKIQFENMGFEVTAKTLTAIAAGSGGPDIVQFHTGWLPDLTGLQAGLENLLDPPYNAGRFENDFTEANWRRYMSIDGKKLLSLPGDYIPGLTLYRSDVMEDYGYPSDPEEFGNFIQDENNFIDMALTLKADDKWVVPWKTDAISIDYGFFDEDLNYTRNNDDYARLFDISKKYNQLGLIGNMMIVWNADANQALASGKLVLVPTTWTTISFFEETAPDTAGKWRATRLPYGGNGAAQGLGMSILSMSKQKEAAWAFIRFVFASMEAQKIFADKGAMVPFKPAAKDPEYLNYADPFLGGQQARKLAFDLLEDVPVKLITPLDAAATKIWGTGFDEMLEKNMDSRAALQKIEEDTMAAVKVDRDALLESMGK